LGQCLHSSSRLERQQLQRQVLLLLGVSCRWVRLANNSSKGAVPAAMQQANRLLLVLLLLACRPRLVLVCWQLSATWP
jgi:hypothetical protein